MSDLQELSQNIKAIRDEARHRWGEKLVPISFREGSVNVVYKPEYAVKLYLIFLSDDPEQYLIDNPGETK